MQSRLSRFKEFEKVVEDYESLVEGYRRLVVGLKRDYLDRTVQLTLDFFGGVN